MADHEHAQALAALDTELHQRKAALRLRYEQEGVAEEQKAAAAEAQLVTALTELELAQQQQATDS